MDLSAQGLRFGTRVALDSLAIRAGEQVLIVGASGTGKTPLLKCLAGLLRPQDGTVRWDGADVYALPPDELRRQQARLGFVFQTDALFDSMTVLDNVKLPLVRRGSSDEEAAARARAALEEVGLGAAADQRPEQLSGGMKKRAGIARAIVARPEVLLADDPLAGLDPKTARQVAQALLGAARDRTLIVALPDPDPLLPIARRIALGA